MEGAEPLSKVATYNVHACVGLDGRRDVGRVARVIARLHADVVGLQEVDGGQLELLAAETGLEPLAAPTRPGSSGEFGNGLLTRHRVVSSRHTDVSVFGREPRGMLEAVLDADGMPLRIVVTHFGLEVRERMQQVRRLLHTLDRTVAAPLVVLGDFNEWRPRAGTLAMLHAAFGRAPAVRSFPAWAPVFCLDRVWVRPHHRLRKVAVVRAGEAGFASDHLPVLAQLSLGVGRGELSGQPWRSRFF